MYIGLFLFFSFTTLSQRLLDAICVLVHSSHTKASKKKKLAELEAVSTAKHPHLKVGSRPKLVHVRQKRMNFSKKKRAAHTRFWMIFSL